MLKRLHDLKKEQESEKRDKFSLDRPFMNIGKTENLKRSKSAPPKDSSFKMPHSQHNDISNKDIDISNKGNEESNKDNDAGNKDKDNDTGKPVKSAETTVRGATEASSSHESEDAALETSSASMTSRTNKRALSGDPTPTRKRHKNGKIINNGKSDKTSPVDGSRDEGSGGSAPVDEQEFSGVAAKKKRDNTKLALTGQGRLESKAHHKATYDLSTAGMSSREATGSHFILLSRTFYKLSKS